MSEKRQPWIKWYPADWMANPELRMCSMAARGLWAYLISLMHQGEPYGHLLVRGQLPTPGQIANQVGAPEKDVSKWLGELAAAEVYSETEMGIPYSRRMVRDRIKAQTDSANGKDGGNPQLLGKDNGGVNPQLPSKDNGEDKAQKLEARSQIPDQERIIAASAALVREFHQSFWPAYPRKIAKQVAQKLFVKARQSGVTLDEIMTGLDRYKLTKPAYADWSHPETWLRKGRWTDEAQTPTAANDVPQTPLQTDWQRRMRGWRDVKFWAGTWGPNPDQHDCQAPDSVFVEFGMSRTPKPELHQVTGLDGDNMPDLPGFLRRGAS